MLSRKLITPLLVLVFAAPPMFAQNFSLQTDSEVKIEGTSNVRDWEADVTELEATFELAEMDEFTLESLTPEMFKTMELSIAVGGIEANQRGLTNNIRKYLKEKDHPNITFNLSEVTKVEWKDGYSEITAEGVINAAGKDNDVTMVVRAEEVNGAIQFSGSQDLKMTDFDIDPPTALLGTVRAVDEFTVQYSVTFQN